MIILIFRTSLVIVANSNTGKTIAPRLAVKLSAGFISNVIEIPSKNTPNTEQIQ